MSNVPDGCGRVRGTKLGFEWQPDSKVSSPGARNRLGIQTGTVRSRHVFAETGGTNLPKTC
jgi:hypothetical protein